MVKISFSGGSMIVKLAYARGYIVVMLKLEVLERSSSKSNSL